MLTQNKYLSPDKVERNRATFAKEQDLIGAK